MLVFFILYVRSTRAVQLLLHLVSSGLVKKVFARKKGTGQIGYNLARRGKFVEKNLARRVKFVKKILPFVSNL